MKRMIERARTLHEALPYIQRFSGKTVVVKYGGHAMVDPELRNSFARDIVLMRYVGIQPVVVHGGGPQINEMLDRLQMETKFVDGMRVTDMATMDIVEMVLGGGVNKDIVALINAAGGRAVGLTGKDGGLIKATKLERAQDAPDLGRVARVESIDPDIIYVLESKGFIPVIAPVAVDAKNHTYNINADLAAEKIATSLHAQKLILMTDVEGVKDGEGHIVSVMDRKIADTLLEAGIIAGGMIPKVQCALSALEEGVEQVHIINGMLPHALLLELFTDEGIGTLFEAELRYGDH